MASEINKEINKRSLVSRLRDRGGDTRPHLVVCGADPLIYTLAEELANAGQGVRLTVIVPPDLRADVPDFAELRGRGVRVLESARLDERTFREAGLAGAAALALVMPDDMVNLHAALCARAVEGDLRLVIRMFNTGLGGGVRRLRPCRAAGAAPRPARPRPRRSVIPPRRRARPARPAFSPARR